MFGCWLLPAGPVQRFIHGMMEMQPNLRQLCAAAVRSTLVSTKTVSDFASAASHSLSRMCTSNATHSLQFVYAMETSLTSYASIRTVQQQSRWYPVRTSMHDSGRLWSRQQTGTNHYRFVLVPLFGIWQQRARQRKGLFDMDRCLHATITR